MHTSEASQKGSSSYRKRSGELGIVATLVVDVFPLTGLLTRGFWNQLASKAVMPPQQERTRTASFCDITSCLLAASPTSANQGKNCIPISYPSRSLVAK